MEIPIEKKSLITNNYQSDNVVKIVEKMGEFSEYDKQTYWHGKHVSSYKGRPAYY